MKKIIIGLGNKGIQYETTRHNIGFMVIDNLIEQWSIIEKGKTRYYKFYKADVNGVEVILIKPWTYMNLSGRAVRHIVEETEARVEDILVICDDVDLLLGNVRIKPKGGTAGHNGLKSITEYLGTENYPRLRLGIGRPEDVDGLTEHVLGIFEDDEIPVLEKVIDKAVQIAVDFVETGGDDFHMLMSRYNRKNGGASFGEDQ